MKQENINPNQSEALKPLFRQIVSFLLVRFLMTSKENRRFINTFKTLTRKLINEQTTNQFFLFLVMQKSKTTQYTLPQHSLSQNV